ncbi:hypothetical protein [Spirulina sp. 06S082]|uniref:hypothetical protein n=1 Tax=Spirulina sp. 06S082 TaxID=3110248 RepID=UPI002B209158|nr:hypothetical protein [Spirulina sp. 06S082]MEA5468919.1 hypothetical protein [Spirulina sp. 06S082]
MAWIHNHNDAVQQLDDNILLYDLAQVRGTNALLSRIPDNLGGVYAWYRRFELPKQARHDPIIFSNAILNEVYKPHFGSRDAHIPPCTKLTMCAETRFSKQQTLEQLSYSNAFREVVCTLLDNALLFQQPLYIGKATNIKNRTRSHINENSILRERLRESKHDLDKCRLLIIGLSDYGETPILMEDNKKWSDDEEWNDNEFSSLEPEKLVEDILSRLFLPLFTLRYG